MPVVGITGGIATGKTTLCDALRDLIPSARFFNADQAARDLSAQDPEAREAIASAFGAEIYSAAGDLNRDRLRAIVFQDAAKRRVLEQILHPRIRRQWSAEARTYRQSPDFFFADIPLLYETSAESLCDLVVVVACSPDLQRQRLLARSALSPLQADHMIRSQMPLSEKIDRADHVVWNNADPTVARDQARHLVQLWRR
jgi:dephospho-CoA kinase